MNDVAHVQLPFQMSILQTRMIIALQRLNYVVCDKTSLSILPGVILVILPTSHICVARPVT